MPELPAQPPQETEPPITRSDAVVVLAYACFAGLWILLSDQVMAWLFTEPAALALVSTYKGMAFVAVTTLLLYLLLRRRGGAGTARRPGGSIVMLAVAMMALVAAGVLREYTSQRATKVAQLQTIADLKAQQVTDWLAERRREAEFIASSSHYPDLYRRWRQEGNAAAGQELQNRLRLFLYARGFNEASLLDQDGRVLWSTHAAPMAPSPDLLAAMRTATDTRRVVRAEPYIQPEARPHLDFVVPLSVAGTPVQAVVVLHAHLDGWLYPTLKAWPVPSASGETMVFRRDGDQIVSINDLRHRPGAALAMRLPISASDLPTARVLRGEVRPGAAVAGNDYRGVAVLGVVRAVPDTDWFLVAKIDRFELLADAMRSAVWIAMAGLLGLLMLAGGLVMARQRQRLTAAEGMREAQAERLRALRLLAAISDSSDDAIFAKDLEGRYVLFNHAASRFVGVPMEAVLGRDDRALFPADQAEHLMDLGRRVVAENRAITTEEALTTPAGERVFLATKAPLCDEDGQVIGTFGISRDITLQKQSERALRESEARLRLLIDHAPVALALFDREMRYLALSRHWRENFEIGDRDVLELSHYEVFPDLPEKWRQAHRRGLSGETVVSEGDKFQRRDGKTLWTRWEVLPWRDADGEIGGILILAENITDRKLAQDALKESEGRFRALVEQSLAGIYIIQDGRFHYVNPGFAAMFGYGSADEIIEQLPVEALVMPEDRARVADNIRQLVGGEISDIHYTFAGLRRDGGRIEVEVHGRRFDYRGRPAVIGLILDITARKAAEDSLRESELRFHDIVNASADWVWEVDAQGRYTYASESVRDLLGYGPEELLGKTPFDFMPPDEATRVAAVFADIVACKAPFRDLENINLRKDGQQVHVASNGMPIQDADGLLLGYRGLDRDISERKVAEAALRESEASYRQLFESSQDAMCTLGTPDWRLRDVNRAAVRMFRADSAEQLLALGPWDISPERQPDGRPSAEAALERIRQAMEEGAAYFEWQHRRLDGEIFAADVLITRVEQHGETLLQATVRDITERKAAEMALQRLTDDLAATLRAIPDLLFEVDENGRYLKVEATAHNLLAAPAEHLLGHTVSEILPPEAAQTVLDALASAARNGSDYGRTITLPLAAGPHHFELSVARKTVASGAGQQFIVLSRDITARKASEAALRARDRYIRALFDNFPFMVWLKDRDSHFLAANKQFAKVAGVSSVEEVLGKTDLDFWPPEMADHFRADDRAVLASGRPKTVEEEITDPEHRFWLETFKSPVELDGEIIGTVGFARDITERRVAEAELKARNDELERFNRATVGRELDVLEMKKTINALSKALGREPPYPLAFLEDEGGVTKP